MTNPEHDGLDPSQANSEVHEAAEGSETTDKRTESVVATVATVGIIGVGVAVVEAAFLPVFVLGAAAALAPKLVPQIGSALKPVFKSTVRGAYKIGQKTKEFVAETHEHVQDIVAEVDSEVAEKGAAANGTAHGAATTTPHGAAPAAQ